jgi:HK97 family phage major capsid protein
MTEQNTNTAVLVKEIESSWSEVRPLPKRFEMLSQQQAEFEKELASLKSFASAQLRSTGQPPKPGSVSDDCARYLAATFINHCEKSRHLDALCSVPSQREALVKFSNDTLSPITRSALTTSDIPLPSQYSGEIRELISQFGVVRKKMMPYPIGMGTARPARMGTRPSFGSVAMSGAFSEKSPTITFASLESHKIGGIVRLPREIDEQSVVSMGHFLARYGAIEFARAEDTWGFLADGTGTYENVKGIVQIARDNTKTVTLAGTKTHASDATLADFRTLRTKVNKAALNGKLSAYYLDSTWETALPAFRTSAEPNVYQRLPDGSAILDGYPIIWTDVLTPYSTSATVDSPIAVFGALSFWWMGEHGSPRLDTSEHIYFANDQLAVRFIEEIDFDYAATDATATMLTAAS